MKVCLLAAGLGTRMGVISDNLHKALLPLGNRAVISRIIDQFPPDATFVVAVGNRAHQVEAFLRFAHPDRAFEFVNVDPYRGPGSGPGHSLVACRDLLKEAFYFTACDTLINEALPRRQENWVAVSAVTDPQNWCTALVDDGMLVTEFEYKSATSKARYAFAGLAYIRDHAAFWGGLAAGVRGAGEVQVNEGLAAIPVRAVPLSWSDAGNLRAYHELLPRFEKNLSFAGKSTEITYRYGERILKLYHDDAKAARWHSRARDLAPHAPEILGVRGPLVAYRFAEGELLSSRLDGPECARFVNWLQKNFWQTRAAGSEFAPALGEFYVDKSRARIAQFEEARLAEGFDRNIKINGLVCEPPANLLDRVVAFLGAGAIPSNFHGDLHADNVICTADGYRLIDWRESFGGLGYGDRYYDLAKFLHTLDLSVRAMDAGDFRVSRHGGEFVIEHVTTPAEREATGEFWKFAARNNYDRPKIEILNALIFLNMSPLYQGDLASYLYLLGRYQLQKFTEGKFA